VISDAYAHAGLLHAVFIQRHTGFEADIGECAVVLILEQKTRRRIASHIDVGPAVIIEIRGRGCHAVTPGDFADAGPDTDVGERAVPVIAIERGDPGRQTTGPAVNGNALPVAIAVLAWLGRAFEIGL